MAGYISLSRKVFNVLGETIINVKMIVQRLDELNKL